MGSDELLGWGGLVTNWVAIWMHLPQEERPEKLWDHLAACYGFPMSVWDTKSQISEELKWTYPGDPEQAPYFRITGQGKDFLMFPYGVVAIKEGEDEPWQLTRMD